MSQKQFNLGFAVALIVVGVTLRLLPHPANFAPVTAIAIFGGALLPRRQALIVPVLIMMISDAFIGFYTMMPVVWACYVLIALAGNFFLREFRMLRTATVTLASSLFFFIATNFAVWISSGMYAHTWTGLERCYILALPFFRNTLAGDCVYTATFFCLFALGQFAARGRLNRLSNVSSIAKQ
jgi:hypothetical protein